MSYLSGIVFFAVAMSGASAMVATFIGGMYATAAGGVYADTDTIINDILSAFTGEEENNERRPSFAS